MNDSFRAFQFIRTLRAASVPFFAAALVIAVGGWQLMRSRDAALADGRKDVQTLTRSLAQHAERTIESVDVTLAAVVERFEGNANRDLLSGYLRQRAGALAQISALVVTDAQGRSVFSAAPDGSVHSDDQRYFAWHRDHPRDRTMHVGALDAGQAGGRAVIPLSRRLNHPDGSFAGVAVALFTLDYFSQSYADLGMGPGSTIGIWSADGQLLARHPETAADLGRKLDSGPMVKAVREASSGVYDVPPAQTDGIAQLVAYQRLDLYPSLVVSTAVATTEALREWQSEASLQGAVLGFCAVALIALGLRIWRNRRLVEMVEAKARASSALLAGTLENMDQGLVMVRPDGRIAVCNSRAAALLDLPAELIASDPVTRSALERLWASEHFEEAGEITRALVKAAGEAPAPHIWERIRANGTVLEIRATPMADGGVVCLYSDITAHRVIEAELTRAKERAEDAARIRTDFLASMSHELRTPLNSVIGFSDLLLASGDLNTPKSQRYARLIQTASMTLLTIVDDVLDVSKLEAGSFDLDPRPFSPGRLVEDTAELVRAGAEAKGIELRVVIDPALPETLIGDDARLRQVLLNLLSNAVKFTTKGFVRITALSEPTDDAALTRVRFRVSDSGIGIPEAKLHRLFERFSQVDGSTSRRFGGTGLGLSICKSLVGLMGGAIKVESVENEGSTFSVIIDMPRAEHMPAAESSPTQPDLAPLHPIRILLVEDVPMNQELVVTLFSHWGCRVDVAPDGATAVDQIRREAYDLVLMDVHMPVMDGVQATQRIRAMGGRYATLPIVAMTANVMADDVARFRAAGMTDHIGKPFDPNHLRAAIGTWTGANRATTSVAPSGRDQEPSMPSVLNQSVFDNLRKTFGHKQMHSLLTKFEAQLDVSFARSPGDIADRALVNREAHRLISTAGALGFSNLSDICREIENACRFEGESPQTLADVLARMRPIRAATQDKLRQILATLDQAA